MTSNGEIMVKMSFDGTEQRSCTRRGDAIGELMCAHKGWVECVEFTANAEMVVSGSRDSSVIRCFFSIVQQIGRPLLHN